jgi:magnesium transporter
MQGTLTVDGASADADRPAIEAALAGSSFFWLDLEGVDGDTAVVLRDSFKFHPLAVEDAENFGQRPKLEDYDGFVYMVVHGAAAGGAQTIEVHIFFSERFVVTVRHGECPAFLAVRSHLTRHHVRDVAPEDIVLVYLIVDSLVDSFFPVLAELDDSIDELEDSILVQPTDQQLGTIFDMKRNLLTMRKVITPQRDMFASVSAGVIDVPGRTAESDRYFRDLYDHLIRISDLVDSYRDLLSGVMDTHLSTVSNRLNVVMKQLAIIATVFLPLTFLTGFFGQNFGWLVNHIGGGGAFVALGLGTEAIAVVALFMLFRRRGWLGGSSSG